MNNHYSLCEIPKAATEGRVPPCLNCGEPIADFGPDKGWRHVKVNARKFCGESWIEAHICHGRWNA